MDSISQAGQQREKSPASSARQRCYRPLVQINVSKSGTELLGVMPLDHLLYADIRTCMQGLNATALHCKVLLGFGRICRYFGQKLYLFRRKLVGLASVETVLSLCGLKPMKLL
jgi:hypothetical protein